MYVHTLHNGEKSSTFRVFIRRWAARQVNGINTHVKINQVGINRSINVLTGTRFISHIGISFIEVLASVIIGNNKVLFFYRFIQFIQ